MKKCVFLYEEEIHGLLQNWLTDRFFFHTYDYCSIYNTNLIIIT